MLSCAGCFAPPFYLAGLYALLLLCNQHLLCCSITALQSACAVLQYQRIAVSMCCTTVSPHCSQHLLYCNASRHHEVARSVGCLELRQIFGASPPGIRHRISCFCTIASPVVVASPAITASPQDDFGMVSQGGFVLRSCDAVAQQPRVGLRRTRKGCLPGAVTE